MPLMRASQVNLLLLLTGSALFLSSVVVLGGLPGDLAKVRPFFVFAPFLRYLVPSREGYTTQNVQYPAAAAFPSSAPLGLRSGAIALGAA